ncbi:MAG: DUF2079 domain-containing protein, partial [Nitrososphaeria archaeon]
MNQFNDTDRKILCYKKINAVKKRFFEYFKKDPYIIILIIFFISFSIYWSYISITKYYLLNAYVGDLGGQILKVWYFIYHPGYYPNLIMWLIFPLFLFKNSILLFVFQAVFVTFGIFPLYGIAKHTLKSNLSALLISISYLFSPFMTGIFWFDFHFQVLFPTLFLIGYYFFL